MELLDVFDSHLKLYKHCLKKKYEYALIFEDDVEINSKNIQNTLKKFSYIIKKYPKWYKINCHNWGLLSYEKKIKNDIHMASGVGNMCYFISRRAMKKSVQTNITQNHIDLQQFFDFPLNRIFYITPPLGKLTKFTSDNKDYGDMNIGKIAFILVNNGINFPLRIHHYMILLSPKIYGIFIKKYIISSLRKEYNIKNKSILIKNN